MMDGPLDALRETTTVVAVSAPPGSGAAVHASELGLASLIDDPTHPRGPLAGLHAGLVWARAMKIKSLLTATCDAPDLLAADLLRLLAATPMDDEAAMTLGSDGPQPLIAMWPVEITLARLSPELNAGRHPPVRRLLDQLGARAVAGYAGGNINMPPAGTYP